MIFDEVVDLVAALCITVVATLACFHCIFLIAFFWAYRKTPRKVAAAGVRHKRPFEIAKNFGQLVQPYGFRDLEVYQIGAFSYLCAWKDQSRSRYFYVHIVLAQVMCEFLTLFDHDSLLITGNRASSNSVPYPRGYFVQSLGAYPLDWCWQWHLAAEGFLNQRARLSHQPTKKSFDEVYSEGMKLVSANIRTIPRWYIKVPYWAIFRPRRFNGKTIMDQYGSGQLDIDAATHKSAS